MRGTGSRSSWVCFDCRQVMRRLTHGTGAVPCSRCGRPARCGGMKLRFPKREDVGGWARLRERIAKAAREEGRGRAADLVRRRHEVERELKRIEARPSNTGRAALIRRLRRELERLRARCAAGR